MKINWKEDGWTIVQEANAEKHVLEISCLAESGIVKEVRIRHNDGEEKIAKVHLLGRDVLPMPLEEFKELYKANSLDFF